MGNDDYGLAPVLLAEPWPSARLDAAQMPEVQPRLYHAGNGHRPTAAPSGARSVTHPRPRLQRGSPHGARLLMSALSPTEVSLWCSALCVVWRVADPDGAVPGPTRCFSSQRDLGGDEALPPAGSPPPTLSEVRVRREASSGVSRGTYA
ncbi:hypothetical protein TRIUR3_21601 [Triticum urartu]|uniref:Uncharacterized protein n=1 Tax=Triticum urartu TaxID=4572 RepID=M8AQ16_TRIUA|nr:hypothetical protein TRIUR3_21601 [Triticum urartu]